MLIYTSGTTGPPKGALHAHRVLSGHLPGFELSHDFFPQPGDLIWTPADWAWIGGLMDVAHARPRTTACRSSPSARRGSTRSVAFDVIADAGVRNVFMPADGAADDAAQPTARARWPLRTITSGGETVGEETARVVRASGSA